MIDLRQHLKLAQRASETHAQFLHSLILKVIARQVQLTDNARLWWNPWCELCTAVVGQVAVAQAEVEQKWHWSTLFFQQNVKDTRMINALQSFQMTVGIFQAFWNFFDSSVSNEVHAEVKVLQLDSLPVCFLQELAAVELRDRTQNICQVNAAQVTDSTPENTERKWIEKVAVLSTVDASADAEINTFINQKERGVLT